MAVVVAYQHRTWQVASGSYTSLGTLMQVHLTTSGPLKCSVYRMEVHGNIDAILHLASCPLLLCCVQVQELKQLLEQRTAEKDAEAAAHATTKQ